MMCDQFPAPGQLVGINRILNKDLYRGIRNGRRYHKRNKKLIAGSDLCNKENGRQGSMQYTCYQASHPDQCKIACIKMIYT